MQTIASFAKMVVSFMYVYAAIVMLHQHHHHSFNLAFPTFTHASHSISYSIA